MSNVIADKSELYKKLLEVSEEKDYMQRFDNCYKLVDDADYKEIHFIVTMLKASENAVADTNISFLDMAKGCIENVFGNRARAAFLLDILEEARERKRDNK